MFGQNQNQKKGSFFSGLVSGFVIGGAIGSTLALLFAPAKGSDTRAAIRKKLAAIFYRPVANPAPHVPVYRNDIEIAHHNHSDVNVVRKVNDGPKKLLLKLASWLEK